LATPCLPILRASRSPRKCGRRASIKGHLRLCRQRKQSQRQGARELGGSPWLHLAVPLPNAVHACGCNASYRDAVAGAVPQSYNSERIDRSKPPRQSSSKLSWLTHPSAHQRQRACGRSRNAACRSRSHREGAQGFHASNHFGYARPSRPAPRYTLPPWRRDDGGIGRGPVRTAHPTRKKTSTGHLVE
jgi:hypothetical protein